MKSIRGTIINSKEKHMLANHFARFDETKAHTIFEAYSTKPSEAKIESYRELIRRLNANNYVSYDARITSHNTSFYTLAAKCYDDGQNVFRVFTAFDEYICGFNGKDLYDLETGEIFYEG